MKLKELPNTVVNTKTQEEYDELMRIYEEAGWRWCDGEKPTEFNAWEDCEQETYVDIENNFGYGKYYYQSNNYKIISLDEFKKIQGLDGFKIGDRVVYVGHGSFIPKGLTGKIVYKHQPLESFVLWGVEWDKEIAIGHDCWGSARSGYGYFVHSRDIQKTSKNIQFVNPVKGGTKKTMKNLKTLAKKLLDKKTRLLLEMEYLNGDLERTQKGTDTLLDILFLERRDDIVEVAKKEKKEMKKLETK